VPLVAVHVLWVIKGLGPGGAERLLVGLAGAHDPKVATFECAYVVPEKCHLVAEMEAGGVPCECVSHGERDMWWPLRLARMVRSGDFDVVHVHSPLPGSVARLAVRTMPKAHRPTVFTTEHNAWKTFRLPTRWLNRLTNRRDRYTFAVSNEVAGSLRGPVVERSAVLVHGVQLDAVRAAAAGRDAMRESLGVQPDDVLVVSVANFRTQKDHPNLLRACAELLRRGVPLRVAVVGQGPLAGEVHALRNELGLGSAVQLLGYRADAVDVLAAADVFVLSSRWEGLPVALMESAALGLPMVLTQVGGMPEAMGADGAQWVPAGDPIALADGLQALLTNPSRRALLAARSTAASAAFDISRAAAEIERRYVPPVPMWVPPVGLEDLVVREALPADEAAAVALCNEVLDLGNADFADHFHWKHRQNPFGSSPMWIAMDGGRVVAVRLFMRWEFQRDGRTVRAVRAVDTATHPEYQGRGLFTTLTLHGLAEMEADGVEFVFNTPNDKSRPGYLKMGWHEVGRLAPVAFVKPTALVRVVRSRVPAALAPEPLSVGVAVDDWVASGGFASAVERSAMRGPRPGVLATPLTEAFVTWRFGSALQPCRVVDDAKAAVVVERRRRGAVSELVCLLSLGQQCDVDRLLRRTMREVGADTAIRLGSANLLGGFVPLPRVGPRLTCRMLRPDPVPTLQDWALTLGDVVLF